jgi:hypothetical protein
VGGDSALSGARVYGKLQPVLIAAGFDAFIET